MKCEKCGGEMEDGGRLSFGSMRQCKDCGHVKLVRFARDDFGYAKPGEYDDE